MENGWIYEKEAINEGFKVICGVDEAGRGPLAGGVYAAAVILSYGEDIESLDDSKSLTEKQRDRLYDIIKEKAIDYHVATATVEEIEEMNILNAAMLAMRRAIEGLKVKPEFVLVDGNTTRGFIIPARAVVKGDSLSMSIAAASILAKVERDRYMLTLHEKYPEYCFDRHKGYATKLHYEMIEKYGICREHRISFLTKRYGNSIKKR
ncbi:MAG: ribonuclease HII [Clostridiales bacterium]|jgi:ribonuclease HII|nr:ribonuclease HII [Clostridiales bacterium]